MVRVARQLLAAVTILCTLVFNAHAADEVRKRVEIPAGDLAAALSQLAKQTGVELIYRSEELVGVRTKGVSGSFTAREAVNILLEGTPLAVRMDASGAMLISAPRPAREKQEGRGNQGSDAVKQESIMVTATKRPERLQDVPISIAVITNEDLERRGATGMQDYLRSIPGVNQVDRGSRDNAIVIRGISSSPVNENFTASATVGTYFDETPVTGATGTTSGGIDIRPVDIERIEVLRGPQGTAHGSSSLGGALRIIPAKPRTDAFEGRAVASISSTSAEGGTNGIVQGVLNIPLVEDAFAVRLVGYEYQDSGYLRNNAGVDPTLTTVAAANRLTDFLSGHVQTNVGDMRTRGGRVAALWQPTSSLSLSANLLTQRIEQDGIPESVDKSYAQVRFPIAPAGRIRGQRGEVADTKLDLGNLVLNLDLGWAALTGAFSRVDGGAITAVDAYAPPGFPVFGSTTTQGYFNSDTTEVRLASTRRGPFQFLGGFFWEDVKIGQVQRLIPFNSVAPNPYGTDPMQFFTSDRTQKQRAAFGELSYSFGEAFTATVGGRYYDYDKSDQTLREGGFYRVAFGAGIPALVKGSDTGTTGKASLTWKVSKDALYYLSWSQGFRLGRPTAGVPASCDTNNDGLIDGSNVTVESTRLIKSDHLDNYEFGAKLTTLDRRLIINSAIYHIKWKGLPTFVVVPGCVGFTANAGSATSNGVELETYWYLAPGLRIDAGVGYNKASLAEAGLGAPKGARLPGTPRVSGNLAAQYEFTLRERRAFVRLDALYAGKFFGDLLQTPETEAGGYLKLDMRAGLTVSRNVSAEVFVKNVTNEDAYTFRFPFAPFPSYQLRPRTVGVQVAYSY